jgi:hypothetical protein
VKAEYAGAMRVPSGTKAMSTHQPGCRVRRTIRTYVQATTPDNTSASSSAAISPAGGRSGSEVTRVSCGMDGRGARRRTWSGDTIATPTATWDRPRMHPAAPPPPTPLPRAPIVAAGVLTASVSTVGLLPWPRPFLAGTTESGWNVSGVPEAMSVLVLGTAMVCVAVGAVLTFRLTGLRPWQPTALGWLLLAVLAAGALVWNALYSAALSVMDFGAVIPIFHWLFTFVPAFLAAALFIRRGRQVRWAAALGTGVVTLPLFHLGSLLLVADDPGAALLSSVRMTAVLAVAPLVGAVGIAGAMGGDERPVRLPYPSGG